MEQSEYHIQSGQEGTHASQSEEPVVVTNVKPKKTRSKAERGPPYMTREPGRSHFPYSRVQKILKADRDLPLVQREATFLISIATEEFIKRIAAATERIATKEKRMTTQQRDVAMLVRRANEFAFLDDVIQWREPEPLARRKPKALQEGDEKQEAGLIEGPLDRFIPRGGASGKDEFVLDDIVMSEDGTMSIGFE
ncbi:uncharacterized protein FIBRA_03973 [Fibroporia radiculosa]|uniref:Transcription factor CBF/NF-Y/archaeal histone domain-containing protein n=1 Tax=Fibroporia radiculosa TaxID=599839 RepID=J4HWA1_9APHY|nr:uncharacterized protein FIBRA_03973 [Fibroporia radiculosa]CCM01902.1 predicted protein [Fibroporia radiculosa]